MAAFTLLQLQPLFRRMLLGRPESLDPTFPWEAGDEEAKLGTVLAMIEDGGYAPTALLEIDGGHDVEDVAELLYASAQRDVGDRLGVTVTDLEARPSAGLGDLFLAEDGRIAVVATGGFRFARMPAAAEVEAVPEPAPAFG